MRCLDILTVLLTGLLLPCSGQIISYPPECPTGKEFNDCNSACPPNCDMLDTPILCTLQCVSGCFCPEGQVELGERCVNPSECPKTEPPYEPTTDPYPPTTDPYPPTTDPYPPTTDPYPPTTDPYPPTDPYPSDPYPYDPYEPYDPYDPYPYYFCDLNEDEYGRPYYGPYDEYRRPYPNPQPYPPYPPTTPGYPTTRPPYPPTTPGYPTTQPPYRPSTQPPYPPTTPGYPTTQPPYPPTTQPPYPPTTPPPYPPVTPVYRVPDDTAYLQRLDLTTARTKRQAPILTLPSCITSNECNQQPGTCQGSGTQYDRCGRRCSCRNGQLVDCCRVRKEWRSMTQVERCRYVWVVHRASTQQPWKNCYDELIKIHRDQFSSGIHGQAFFLPWHRWFILALENLLRQVDCNTTVPYWDWSLEPQTWTNSIVWADQCGLGGNGNPANNDYVSTGIFREDNWDLTPSANQDTGGDLQRRFNGAMPDCASVAMIQRLGIAEYNTWHNFVSSNLHDAVHCYIGGTMCSADSANAPEFFLHHGFIDKIWLDWQNKGPGYKNMPQYAQNSNAMPGAFGHSPRTVYDLDNQPGCVRVCIEPSARPCRLGTTYSPVCPREMRCYDYSPLKLANLIPRPYPTVPPAAYELFNTPYEIRRSSMRFEQLFSDYDALYGVLQSNGYNTGYPLAYRPSQGELQFDRYIYQAPSPSPDIYATNTTLYYGPEPHHVPPECEAYFNKK